MNLESIDKRITTESNGCQLTADNLHLSLSTVKVHVSNIFRKLNVHSRSGIVDKLTRLKKWNPSG